MDIVSGGTAGVVNFHNGITDGVPGDILFKHRTLGTDNTAPGHTSFGGDGIHSIKGMYVTYTDRSYRHDELLLQLIQITKRSQAL